MVIVTVTVMVMVEVGSQRLKPGIASIPKTPDKYAQ